jgi:type I restriction enzyme R subunit
MIYTYDMRQAEKDGAVLEILYEPRLVNLQLVNENIDEEAKEIGEGDDVEVEKKWSAVERAAGTDERQEEIAADIVEHFRKRQDGNEEFDGVGMIVCMSRRNCVGLYDAITDLRPE